MRLTTEQILEITSGAPAGMNHIGDCQGKLVPMPNTMGTIHNLDDLREIAELRQQRDALQSAVITALRGTLLDDQGNRDDDGLIPFGNTKTAIRVLSEADSKVIQGGAS